VTNVEVNAEPIAVVKRSRIVRIDCNQRGTDSLQLQKFLKFILNQEPPEVRMRVPETLRTTYSQSLDSFTDSKASTYLSPMDGIRVLDIPENTPFAQWSLTGFDSIDGTVDMVVGEVEPSERDGGMSEENVPVDGEEADWVECGE
jgi:hypothetical protein